MLETEKEVIEIDTVNPSRQNLKEQDEGPQLFGTFFSVLCVLGFIIGLWGYMFLLFSSR